MKRRRPRLLVALVALAAGTAACSPTGRVVLPVALEEPVPATPRTTATWLPKASG